jgi:phenylalanine-4-hydroxylase
MLRKNCTKKTDLAPMNAAYKPKFSKLALEKAWQGLMIEYNEVIDKLPPHLKQFIVDQDYSHYTPIDQAVWRYVMRQNYSYLSKVAHGSYVEGLQKTGIGIDMIAQMYGMNRILKDIGWAAVAVDGFIPPSAFMEFQAYKILVIAADIRQLEHIEYTPAPDIIHEAAGHAPIIADAEYSEYLRLFGEIGSKAFSSSQDYDLYEAVRHLSIIKEFPNATAEEISEAEHKLEEVSANMGEISEMARIRNLHWWTVEYGLIGTPDDCKIYGAGLLSSIGESVNCMKPEVKKIPYTIAAADTSFDITKEQPQLFVTPSFKQLVEVLQEFADTMALRRGGLYGIETAIKSGNVGTAVYSSGLQVSGVFDEGITDKDNNLVYIHTTGPTSLAYKNKELSGHGKSYHADGFGSPVGRLKGTDKPLEQLTELELVMLGIVNGLPSRLEFESGVVVEGVLREKEQVSGGQSLVFVFDDCTVTYGDRLLYDPDWGTYDMAVGESIVSVFSGAADVEAYKPTSRVPHELTKKIVYTPEQLRLQKLYGRVREIRDSKRDYNSLPGIFNTLQNDFKNDWLLCVEIYEILKDSNLYPTQTAEIKAYLEQMKERKPEYKKLIEDGIRLTDELELTHS